MDFIRRLLKGDRVIWIIYLLLCVISIIEVFSATSTLTYRSGDHWEPVRGHVFFLVLGTGIVVLFHKIPYKWFQSFPVVLLPVAVAFLAFVSIMGVVTGDRVNGAARWLTFLGVQFQPSEIGKMAVVIVTAYILSKQNEDGASPKAFKYIMIIAGLVCGLIAPENLSTALLLFGVVVLMMFVGRVAWKQMGILFGYLTLGVVLIGVLMVVTPRDTKLPFLHRMPTWKNRVVGFFDPNEVPVAEYDIDKNAQVAHAHIAIARSNMIGKAPGNSVQRDFLSQAFSDFIFAIVIEELGLLGGIALVAFYIWLLMRVGRIARKCNRTFPAFLVMGIAFLLVSQALLNMMVAVGLFPVTGQPLPLISKGGTSTLVNCAYIGILLSVSCYTNRLEEQEKAAREAEEERLRELAEEEERTRAAEPTAEILNSDVAFE